MIHIKKKEIILLSIAPLLCIAMIIIVPLITMKIGKTVGYIASFLIYWFIFCLPINLKSFNGFNS